MTIDAGSSKTEPYILVHVNFIIPPTECECLIFVSELFEKLFSGFLLIIIIIKDRLHLIVHFFFIYFVFYVSEFSLGLVHLKNLIIETLLDASASGPWHLHRRSNCPIFPIRKEA